MGQQFKALITAVELAKREESAVTSKPRYDFTSKGLVVNAHDSISGEAPRVFTDTKLSHCATGCSPLADRRCTQILMMGDVRRGRPPKVPRAEVVMPEASGAVRTGDPSFGSVLG